MCRLYTDNHTGQFEEKEPMHTASVSQCSQRSFERENRACILCGGFISRWQHPFDQNLLIDCCKNIFAVILITSHDCST